MRDRIKAALSSPRFNEFISNRVNQWIILGALVALLLCMLLGFFVFIQATAPDTVAEGAALPAPGAALLAAIEQQVAVEAPPAAPDPAVVLPCKQPRLTAGQVVYSIQERSPAGDGTIDIPSNAIGFAYWITGTTVAPARGAGGYVFALSPEASNLALQPGDPLKLVWADCSEENFVVGSVEPGPVDAAALLQPSEFGLRVFVPGPDGFVVNGVRAGVLAHEPTTSAPVEPTAVPIPSEPTAANPTLEELTEVVPTQSKPDGPPSFEVLDTTLSGDGTTLKVIFAITNNGNSSIPLNTVDISLTGPDAQTKAPQSVEPSLPFQIKPGERSEFTVSFSNPSAITAILKVLYFSVDLYN